MPFEKTSLRNQLSRRIFGLFILSALIPILTITLISFNHVSKQLEKESIRQVYRESRATGLIIYDRLLSLESNLKLIANALNSSSNRISLKEDEWLRSIYKAVFVVETDGIIFPLFGDPVDIGKLSSEQQTHLLAGNTLLHSNSLADNEIRLFLAKSIESSGKSKYLVGHIDNDYIRDIGIYSPDIFCLLDQAEYDLFCSNQMISETATKPFLGFRESAENNFSYWEINGREYGTNTWDIFLEAHFAHENLSVLIARPRQTLLHTFNQFKNIFPKTLIITGLLVALLSINQIRRSMIPLEKLMEGTSRLSRGEFDQPVDIKSGDEFEQLGASFNDMAQRLNEQFRIMKALSVIVSRQSI